MVERLARSQAVGVNVLERRGERVGSMLGLCRGGKKGQIVEPSGDSAGRIAPSLELGQHRLGPRNHRWRKARELRNRDSVAAVGGAIRHFVEENELAFPLARTDVMEREAVESSSKPSQLMIMGREQGPALHLVMHRLDDRPRDRKPIVSRGAASDLVEDDEASLGGLREDGRRLDHFYHESRAAAGKIVRGADAAEQAVDYTDGRFSRGDKAAGLREHGDERRLAKEGRLTPHVWTGDQ